VNVAGLAAAEVAMRDRKFIARTVREVRRSYKVLQRGLSRLGIPYFPSAGNFVLARFGPRAKEIVSTLNRKGILLRDRSSDFAGEGYVRITLGTPPQTQRLLRELKELL
jgi:histidinol-phosphate aminotransferase